MEKFIIIIIAIIRVVTFSSFFLCDVRFAVECSTMFAVYVRNVSSIMGMFSRNRTTSSTCVHVFIYMRWVIPLSIEEEIDGVNKTDDRFACVFFFLFYFYFCLLVFVLIRGSCRRLERAHNSQFLSFSLRFAR